MFFLLLLACKNPLKDTSVPADCDPRLLFYADADGDGAGSEAAPYLGCTAPEGFVSTAGDCDDSDPSLTGPDDCDTALDTGSDTGDSGADTGV